MKNFFLLLGLTLSVFTANAQTTDEHYEAGVLKMEVEITMMRLQDFVV